jgi:hypothetical protein
MTDIKKLISCFKMLFVSVLLFFNNANAQLKILYSDVLNNDANWIIEQQPNGKVNVENGKMEIVDAKGCTVWFKNLLEGNLKIEYDVVVINQNGPFDRVSDLNCFWMANDPNNPDDFFKESKQRAGHFPNYHHLKLYYVGYGGHNNSKTRFRRYDGNLDRPLLPEHDLSEKKYLIVANKKMHIEILVKDNYTSFKRDGEVILEMNDSSPYTSGYFGFRTVENHMKVENFKITKL